MDIRAERAFRRGCNQLSGCDVVTGCNAGNTGRSDVHLQRNADRILLGADEIGNLIVIILCNAVSCRDAAGGNLARLTLGIGRIFLLGNLAANTRLTELFFQKTVDSARLQAHRAGEYLAHAALAAHLRALHDRV